MTWRERVVCQILLLVAKIVAKDSAIEEGLRRLANDISVHGSRADA